MYMQKENAAVVTKCLRIQHVPSNLRNCASYSKLHDGCVSLCTEYIRNTNYTMHACTRTSEAFKVQSRDIIIRLLVTSSFKTVHFQLFCKNYYDEVNGCIFTKLTQIKSKKKIAIYN